MRHVLRLCVLQSWEKQRDTLPTLQLPLFFRYQNVCSNIVSLLNLTFRGIEKHRMIAQCWKFFGLNGSV